MANIATLSVSVVAKTGAFLSGTEKVIKRVNRMERQFKSMIGTTGRLAGAFVALAGVGGMGALLKTSIATVDSLAKTADKLGITTQALTSLRHAAELSGVASNTLDMALQRMVRRVSEAAHGFGEAKGALAELGIDAQRLAQMTPDQQMRTLADAFGLVEAQADKVRLAMKLFDSEGVALVNTLALGRSGLDQVTGSINRLGGAIDRNGAAKVEMFNDAMSTFQLSVKLASDRIAVQLAPAMEYAANVMIGMSLSLEQIVAKVYNFAKGVGELLAAWLFFTRAVPTIIKVVQSLGAGIAIAIETATLGAASIIKLILKGVAYLSAMLVAWWGVNEAIDSVIQDAQKAVDEFEEIGRKARNLEKDLEVPTKAFENMKWAAADVVKQTKKIGDVTQKVTQEVKTSPISPIANQPRFSGAVAAGSQEAIRLIAQNRSRGDNLQRELLGEAISQTKLLELIGRKIGGGGSITNNTVVAF